MEKVIQKLCAFAVLFATIAPNVCRANWYQPNEPEGLEKFLNNRK